MIGKTISHYRILEKLGQGGAGVVYKAEDTRLKRIVALKFLANDALSDPEERQRFIREARAAAGLDHPNICTVHEIDQQTDRIFIAMTYVDGQTLHDVVKRAPLSVEESIRIGTQIAEGLEAAHRKGVVHRDVKSGNVMINDQGRAIITDFGLAKMIEGAEVTTTDRLVGTPAFMSPEQLRGESIDLRTDVWSWGVLMYEALSGRLPFERERVAALIHAILDELPEPLTARNSRVSLGLERVIERAMAKPVDARYQSMNELLCDLQAVSAGVDLPPPARTPGGRRSIAVLAFADMSPQRDQEHFCDGIAEQVINDLTRLTGLRVASRTSAFAYKGEASDIRHIGRRLGVSTVLEGSVRKADNRVRVTAKLVNVADGCPLWSTQYDRELEDIFAIQDEIAGAIVEALEVELSDEARRALRRTMTRDIEAYDLYLRGRQFFYRSKRQSIENALTMFSRATARDPNYALAHAGMADCHSYLGMYFGGGEDDLRKAREASALAMKLDPELAEAHAASGLALSLSKRHAEAEVEFEAALKLNPKLFEAYYFFARSCFAQGRTEQAARLFAQAALVNPDDYQAPSLLAFCYRTLERDEKAQAADRRTVRIVERHLELNPGDSRALYLAAQSYLMLGETQRALSWTERFLRIDADDPYIVYGAACIFSQLGQIERALDYFEQAVAAGFVHREWIENDVDLDGIRPHPRFRAVLDRLDAQARHSSGS